MTINTRAFRNALSQFVTGVTVVTGATRRGVPVGVTVNAFAALSLKPPLVLVCLQRAMRGLSAFIGAGFAVNVLSEGQRPLSVQFAGRFDRRFKGVAFERGDGGCPILAGCLAAFECAPVAAHDGGDHIILIGRVERLHGAPVGRPLVYFQSGYRRLGGKVPARSPKHRSRYR